MTTILIRNIRIFDGSQSPSFQGDLRIQDGIISEISSESLLPLENEEVVEGQGLWLTPGFIDFHTHYDAEIEVAPDLSESVRHGVTTISLGSCSLSLSLGDPVDLADMFSRVEAIPRKNVLEILEKRKNWNGAKEYKQHLNELPLGPNVTSFAGHSAIRAHVMGLERSLTKGETPSKDELEKMNFYLEDALNEGFMGLSINTLVWDKMDGSRFRSRPLPSTFASWKEYRYLNRTLRKRGKIFQGVPNVSTKINLLMFLWEALGIFRKPLKTTIISLMDVKYDPRLYKLLGWIGRLTNKILGSDFKYQSLPEPFDLYADGMDVVVFEEFGAGAAANHIEDELERRNLMKSPKYRSWFKRQWTNWFLPRVFHRDFRETKIVSSPDPSLIGKSIDQIAKERNVHSVTAFLDLIAEYGNKIRWYTVMANHRKEPLQKIVSHPDILIGFSDAGAHLRGMAHYNFPLRMLKLVYDAEKEKKPFMSLEHAVYRLTGEIADWFGIDAGYIQKGKRADLVVIDPTRLNEELEKDIEAPMPFMEGFQRWVRRNDQTIKRVYINGKLAVKEGIPVSSLGKETGYGKFLESTLGN
ncbi:N-acyl-D-amino-acid deacylase family protein [Leptospira idonii]|uniref:N-acyl-D-glutamate amidohydrolase n=1 Tax=Leptospira idonii TaxID=1193500 RepID=A0A4R9M3B0_9LEPT|nr:amidohydrolase family protein [Leptospira idonii]TGN20612.1 N-acyl-D-glutamate amidohydrolase [Leptospira idonii]